MLQRRGLIGDIPILDDGELGFATDTDQLFIGENGTNVLINPLIVGIQASTGPADADKFIKTDAFGVIDDTFLPAHHVKYTDLEARDAVGGILLDSTSINLTYVSDTSITATIIASGIDHGSLNTLSLLDDDHTQYHTDTRGDVRYYKKTEHIASVTGLSAEPIITSAAGYVDATLMMTEDAITTDRTVPVGYTYTHLNSDVQAGTTLTVDGSFVTMNPQVSGSMSVSGSVTVIPNTPIATQPQGGFNIVSVSDMDYTASIIDHVIYNGLSAARTVTIPTGTAGDRLKIMDGTGNASALTPILVDNLGGSATFDGILGPLTLTTSYEHVELVNLTGNAWSVVK